MQRTNREIIHQHMQDLRNQAREHERAIRMRATKKSSKHSHLTHIITLLKR